jgi:hypothetical protein
MDGDNRRKLLDNLVAYGGAVRIVTLTPPGADVLRWGEGNDRRVDPVDAELFNLSASRRARRLFQAAAKSADRYLRLMGYRGRLPRSLGVVWAPMRRGVWHIHWALPNESPAEKLWSRTVVRFMDKAWRTEAARYTANERRLLLELEAGQVINVGGDYGSYSPPRGFYGWGFVDRHDKTQGVTSKAAHYLSRNAAGYLGRNVASGVQLPGRKVRLYVSSRLTRETGVTIRNLRRLRQLYVRRARAEIPLVPERWSPRDTAHLLRMLDPVSPAQPQGP